MAVAAYHGLNSVFNGVCNSDYRWHFDEAPTECSETCGGGDREYEVKCLHEGGWQNHDNNCFYWTMPEPKYEAVCTMYCRIFGSLLHA